jgi:hypothetical protein
MTPEQSDALTATLENYFLGLVTKQQPESVARVVELSMILLEAGRYGAVRDSLTTFLSELSRQLTTLSNGSGKP